MTEVKQVNTQAMIQIKRNNKVFFTLEDFGEGSKLSYQLMDHHYIILKFTTATPVYFEIGDSVEIPDFGYFELTSSYFPKHNDSDGYDYEMQMDAYYMSWKNKLCKYRPQHGANETSFNLTTTVGVHMNVILGNLKALGLTYNGKDFSVDYTTYNNKAFDVQKRFLIEYGSISILDALNAICSEDALNCEWWIDGSIIYLGYCEMEGQATFEQDVNVLSMSYSESKSTYITRLYAFGSDRNIPKGYFTGADADVTTDGVATDYLMLPNKEVDSDGFYAKDGYLENVNVVKNDKQAIEGVVMFEEEYPKVESVVSSIKTYDSTVDNEDGTKTTQTFWQVTSTDSFTNSFKESWIKSNLTLGIKFTSGALMGMEFDVSFKVIDKVNYFEIVANDTYGRTLPDGVMCPKVGDKFFLYNWDATKITDTDLIPTAQLSLFDRAKQYYQKTMISNSNFTCTMDGDKFYNDGIYDYHPLGEQVKLINDMFAQVDADGKHYRNSRIIGMEIPLDIPYDHPQYTVGEKAATSRLGKLEDKVDSIKVNGMQIGGTGSGNGGGVYVIGMNDTTPASDSNVYSARRSRMEFVSRLQDNTAKGTITWEKVQKLLSGLLIGNSNNENGGSWIPDAEGRSHLITDYLEVRMKAIFEELVINKTSTIGGKEIISPAGGVVAHKVEEVTVTYNNVSQKAYRCYFLAEQEGDAVDNDFAVGDQVRSESFNVRKGTYHKDGNHFYWRLVIGRDEDPVELEGKKYHYIDLSDTDCATASDVPAKGDVLNQCGNRTDIERQNCLIFSAVDTYSPSISLYHGINSYSFANREYVEYGVNKQNNKAFFNVYGDMYVGDRPTKENGYEGSSYIRYDSSTKQMSVKAKISAKSTVDGKELSQYFKKIGELQNQVDGAIETWFYEGVPTLENAPAISWKTDKDKEIHLGDLYYNNKTGKAYRFAKDSNTYKWTLITDTDIAKALSDARMAQETANGKMKVFSVQPTTPYQVGDIWVNATYPSDGSTYKNEVLRCQTNKAAGSQFAIGDWIKASKYTDDTVANAAKKAAEDAQKAAQTAQTDIKNLGNTVTDNKKEFDNYVTDGYLEPSEIAAMAQDSKRLEDDFAAAQKSYNEVKNAEVLANTKELTDLNTAFATLTSAKTELVTYLSDISKRYNETDTNGKAAIVSAVGTKFTNFQSAYSAFYDKLGLANAYITSKIYGDLQQNITDLAGYKYLKDALGQTTDIDGGLVMTTLLALRDGDGNVQSGINGAIDPNRGKKSIATWWGGQMVDKDYNSGNLTPATSLIRFDGSGYLANGAIWWDVSGKVHADPTSFIISEKNLGAYLIFFEPTWKAGSAGTSVADLVSLKPNAPFSKLGVSGDATFEGAISFHGIKLTYDSTNKAIKIDGNLYATGGITAYGAGASTTGGGGGLNGSVKSYSSALKLTSESLSEIASAYSIKALDSRISSLEGGSAMDVSVSGSGNAVTSVTKNGTTISVVKGSTFLTSHQSLDGYVNAISVSGSGNAITSVSKSGKGITFTKGATFLTSHQSLANYYTKSSVDSLLSGKSATSHTHSVIINGTTKIIAASGGTAVNLGTYLTSHQSLADYAKKTDIPTSLKSPNSLSWSGYNTGSYDGSSPKSFVIPSNTNQLTNGAGFITSSASISGNAATATKVNHSLLVFGKSFNGSADVTVADTDLIASISTGTSNVTDKTEILTSYASDNGFNDSNAKNKIHRRPASAIWGYINSKTISNADKLDNVHLNGIFTALSNTNNGVSMTIGTVAKSLANMQVYSATKLVTARKISIAGRDFVGNVNFDGTGNVSLNGAINYCTINIGNTDPNPFKRIAHIKVARSWNDNALLLYISQGYYGGNFGLCRVEFRTNDIANSDTAGGGVSLRWLIRQGYATDSIQAGYYIHLKNAYVDVFLKTTGAYQGTVIRVIQDSRGSINNRFGLINSTYNTEAYTSLSAAATALYNVAYQGTVSGTDTCTVSHANSATKLQTPRTIWGQSFDGTGNVNGTIYINNSDSENGAIILNNNVNTHARISAIKDQVVFNTGAAIRFGATNWEYSDWAGLKYDTVANAIYLGIADGTVFNYYSNKRSNGTLKFPGITTITPDSEARIGGSGGNLYLGNANNSGYVYVQDMCSQINSSYWIITQYGSATFKSLTVTDVISCNSINVSKNAVIAGNLSVNGLINNKGILPTNYEVNNKGTNCYVSADALCSGITAITDSIPVDNLSIVYSNDNGTNWTNYNISNDTKFKAYANVAGVDGLTLGGDVITGNNDAEKLAQIKKNQLMFTFYVPNVCYSQVYFACVDITRGVGVTCTVEYLNSKGVIVNTFVKYMNGWNQFNYINLSNGNEGLPVGNDSRRYIRFKFKHDQNTTELRNASINKIRIFAFTKYSFPTDRFMGHTGHIYNFDYNMNTYFPNSILAKGGVTAYQSSDIRLKQDLRKLDYLGIIKAMGGTFGFAWKKDNTRSIGWIAQHVLCNPHLKDIVETDEKGYYKINYWSPKLIATAFGAIEQVGDEVSRLKARVVFLESEVQRLSGDKKDCNKKRLDNKNINSLN